VVGGHGSIRNTLVHVLSAEWGWLSRCGGPERGPALKPGDYPTFRALMKTWSTVEGYVRGFLANLKDEDLARTVDFTNPQGEKRWTRYFLVSCVDDEDLLHSSIPPLSTPGGGLKPS
jgi:uncharacterized damage-inducible protein DinB